MISVLSDEERVVVHGLSDDLKDYVAMANEIRVDGYVVGPHIRFLLCKIAQLQCEVQELKKSISTDGGE